MANTQVASLATALLVAEAGTAGSDLDLESQVAGMTAMAGMLALELAECPCSGSSD